MTTRTRSRALKLLMVTLAVGTLAAYTAASAGATATTIYNNIPAKLPGNVVSQPFEASSSSEFGGQVEFVAPGAGNHWKNPVVAVTMSVWACEQGNWYNPFPGNNKNPEEECVTKVPANTFEVPITISMYQVNGDNSPGTKIGVAAKVFKLKYRPSTSSICNSMGGGNEGGWFKKSESTCYHGLAQRISLGVKVAKLPEKAIISVAFNTEHYGYTPLGKKPCDEPATNKNADCPWDSLNVGAENALSAGSYPLPGDAYINSTSEPEYCGSGTTLGTFGISGSPGNECWTGFQPQFKVTATEALGA
jgi:hypothetical protein